MSRRDACDPKLLDLFDKAISLDASESELQQLNARLRDSDDALQQYRNFAAMHADLAGAIRLSRARQLVYEDIRSRASESRVAAQEAERETLVAARSVGNADSYADHGVMIDRNANRGFAPFLRKYNWLAGFSLAAMLLLAAFFMHRSKEDRQQADHQDSLATASDPSFRVSEREIVAYVAGLDGVTWKKSSVQYERHDALTRDNPLFIDAGHIDIEFVDGARVTVAGPAEFVVRSEWSADLRRGRLSANVPDWASGFTVNAPHFRAIDRGTSFALEVGGNEDSGAVVLDGVVDIDRRHLKHASEEASYMRLRKGDGIWMDQEQVILDGDEQQLVGIARRAPPIPRIEGEAVANYRNEFQVGSDDAPTRSPRWRYLCNDRSPFGDPSGYGDLLWDGQVRYDFDGFKSHPSDLPYRFLSLSANGGHPGLGVHQRGSKDYDLFVIAAYAVPRAGRYRLESAWVLAKDWQRWSDRENQDLEVAVHVENRELSFRDTIGLDGFLNFDCELGELMKDDVIYVGVGPGGDAARDSFKWNFTVVADSRDRTR